MKVCLTGLDVHSIQDYLCATGKLKEIIGASGLVKKYSRRRPVEIARELGLQQEDSPVPASGNWFVPVRHAGGVVRFIFPARDQAKRWTEKITAEILQQAPSMNIDVAHVPYDTASEDLLDRLGVVHRELAKKRNRPHAGAAFAGLPITALCNLTGDPAEGHWKDSDEPLSASCQRKRRFAEHNKAHQTLRRTITSRQKVRKRLKASGIERDQVKFPLDFNDLPAGARDKAEPYMAVACFDGNSVGNFIKQYLIEDSTGDAIGRYARFCRDLDEATFRAFDRAAGMIATRHFSSDQPDGFLPLRPLIQGGDDITVVVSAQHALEFARSFMTAFEQETRDRFEPGLTIGGGMALVKRKSPFLRAYELAESMLNNVKNKTRQQSCLDFQMVQNDHPLNIRDLRRSEYTTGKNGEVWLTRKPYTLSELPDFLEKTRSLLTGLPRGQLNRAARFCRVGPHKAHEAWLDIRENVARRLGGRRGVSLMSADEFNDWYEDGFFEEVDGLTCTDLIDCLEAFRFVNEMEVE
jgi:hypothetical protein